MIQITFIKSEEKQFPKGILELCLLNLISSCKFVPNLISVFCHAVQHIPFVVDDRINYEIDDKTKFQN